MWLIGTGICKSAKICVIVPPLKKLVKFYFCNPRTNMKNSFRRVQFLANVAIIFIALFLGIIAVKQLFAPSSDTAKTGVSESKTNAAENKPKPDAKTTQINPVGKTVPLEAVDWKENKSTLVLYLSSACRFCSESSPLYKKLVEKNAAQKVKLVAVLPQSVEDGKKYLKDLGVEIKDVHSSRLSEIGVSATPTLLLVNEDGVVSEMWRGKLNPERETQLLERLFGGQI